MSQNSQFKHHVLRPESPGLRGDVARLGGGHHCGGCGGYRPARGLSGICEQPGLFADQVGLDCGLVCF